MAVSTKNGPKVKPDDDESPDNAIEYAPPQVRNARHGFFSVYKRGQGYATRMGTAMGAGLLVTVLALFVYEKSGTFYPQDKTVPAILTAVFVAGGLGLAWWLMNKPRSVDFLIATDAEMKKVNWTSRQELIGSTRVVIMFMFMIAMLLFLIDLLAGLFFQLIGLLKFGPLS